jgi:hypothetical protein
MAKSDLYAQSGGDIDPSIMSTCLENLEDLGKKGVDMEVIRNTAGIIYGGRLCFTIVRYPPDCLPQERQAPWVS